MHLSKRGVYAVCTSCEEVVKTATGRWHRIALALAFGVASPAAAQLATEWRSGYLECGRTQIRALAECYEATPHCVSETLSFSRRERRVRVGLHGQYEARTIAKVPVQVLDYRAASWACVAGAAGGHYVLVSLARTTGGSCAACEYKRLYELNGRLVASTVMFDARGEPRPDDGARTIIGRLVAETARRDVSPVYR